jgi:hypothetical protein
VSATWAPPTDAPASCRIGPRTDPRFEFNRVKTFASRPRPRRLVLQLSVGVVDPKLRGFVPALTEEAVGGTVEKVLDVLTPLTVRVARLEPFSVTAAEATVVLTLIAAFWNT